MERKNQEKEGLFMNEQFLIVDDMGVLREKFYSLEDAENMYLELKGEGMLFEGDPLIVKVIKRCEDIWQ